MAANRMLNKIDLDLDAVRSHGVLPVLLRSVLAVKKDYMRERYYVVSKKAEYNELADDINSTLDGDKGDNLNLRDAENTKYIKREALKQLSELTSSTCGGLLEAITNPPIELLQPHPKHKQSKRNKLLLLT